MIISKQSTIIKTLSDSSTVADLAITITEEEGGTPTVGEEATTTIIVAAIEATTLEVAEATIVEAVASRITTEIIREAALNVTLQSRSSLLITELNLI